MDSAGRLLCYGVTVTEWVVGWPERAGGLTAMEAELSTSASGYGHRDGQPTVPEKATGIDGSKLARRGYR
jgi:hypothetical protein